MNHVNEQYHNFERKLNEALDATLPDIPNLAEKPKFYFYINPVASIINSGNPIYLLRNRNGIEGTDTDVTLIPDTFTLISTDGDTIASCSNDVELIETVISYFLKTRPYLRKSLYSLKNHLKKNLKGKMHEIADELTFGLDNCFFGGFRIGTIMIDIWVSNKRPIQDLSYRIEVTHRYRTDESKQESITYKSNFTNQQDLNKTAFRLLNNIYLNN